MTQSSHRFTTLSADDVALCRAHSEAIDDARESRALQRWADAVAPLVATVMSVRAFEVGNHMPADLPMPPSYWDDLDHWLKTLAPAKPAAEQPEPAADVWHSEAPSVAGVYETRPESCDASKARLRWWDGSAWHMNHDSTTASIDDVRKTGVRNGSPLGQLLWRRLIEADKPAQQPAQKASTHSVCIKAYVGATGFAYEVGYVCLVPFDEIQRIGGDKKQHWLPCDESGWVTHVPTADAVCPVPAGVAFEVRLRDHGMLCPSSNEGLRNALGVCWWRKGLHNRAIECNADIIAWRPIAQS